MGIVFLLAAGKAADSSKPAHFASPADGDLGLCCVGTAPYPPAGSASALPFRIDIRTMSLSPSLPGVCRTAALLVLLGGQAGCTSVLTTGSLGDLLWKAPPHAASRGPSPDGAADATDGPDGPDSAAAADAAIAPGDTLDAGRRSAAIEEAVARLSRLGRLDAATEATLVETLQRTQPEDWPVVVEAFTAALPPVEPAQPDAERSEPPTTPPSSPAPAASAAATTGPAPVEDATPHSVARPVPVTATPAAPEPPDVTDAIPAEPVAAPPPEAATGPALKMQSACFASRVRGWGDVERFPAARFEPGQEVIVYFELDGLTTAATAAGHTTRIDTVLALLGPDGSRLHSWRFDPLEETSRQRRRDYFARYLIRLPAAAVGPCRLEVSVSDALAHSSTGTTLPLDVIPATDSGR
jgi:outer membrane biosynthesis protein TonB